MRAHNALPSRKLILALLASSAGLLAATTASAQAIADSETSVDEVVVTGSRVVTGERAPTPVTAIAAEQLQASAPANIAHTLDQMPSFQNTYSSHHGGNGSTGGDFLNLRNLGANRTLVLLDGRRFQSGNVASIPQGLIRQIDIVTGGASAAYGSDAVAGVVNFVLDTEFEGLKGQIQAGSTQYADGRNYMAQLSGGAPIAGGRGHVLVNMEHAKSFGIIGDQTGDHPPREWMSSMSAVVANPDRSPGQPPFIVMPNATIINHSYAGIIVSGPLAGTTFNPDGTARPFQYGNLRSGVWATGGEGWDPAGTISLASPYQRSSFFGRASYEVTPDINIFVEGMFAKIVNESVIGHSFTGMFAAAGVPILIDNPYLPAAVREGMVANGLTSIRVAKLFEAIRDTEENQDSRAVVGAEGRFNETWRWNAYYQYGQNDNMYAYNHNPSAIAFANALDAVTAPDGRIVCRVQLTNPSDPCVPYNIFGDRGTGVGDSYTQAEHDYLFPEVRFFSKSVQHVAEAQIAGSPFSTWAGPVETAVGAGYRKESLENSTDSMRLSGQTNPYTGNLGALGFANRSAVSGSFDLWEVFGEAQIPLLSGAPLAESLDINLAGRYTDYSTSGGVSTWKAGVIYVPFEGVRLRAALSRDVRAANIVELFSPRQSGYGTVVDPANGNISYLAIPVTSGNPDLAPEEADTFTAGIVYRPSFLPRFLISVDYYSIKVNGSIGTLGAQRTVDLCASGLTEYCSLITRDASNLITEIRLPRLNIATAETSGVDIELGYSTPLSLLGREGNFSGRAFINYVQKVTTQPVGAPETDIVGMLWKLRNGIPHWKWLATTQYTTGPWSVSAVGHYVGGGKFDNTLPDFPGNDTFDGQFWVDLTLRREFGSFELYGSVNNVFNTDPTIIPGFGQTDEPTNTGLYDTHGRRFVVGLKFAL